MKIEIRSLTLQDPGYPPLLKEIKDPPPELYYAGNAELLKTRCVSVVGSRTTTAYGRNTARSIGHRLGVSGITVVSGMATGIDSSAHEGALDAGGGTIAVLGCGPDVCYPKENELLMQAIRRDGLILSEYPPGTAPRSFHFPRRNRIISGLSEMTVVVQARSRSGALITAELAEEQGRQVYAVPGNIDSLYNLGTNKLIQEGADPLIRVEDVVEALGAVQLQQEDISRLLSVREQEIYALIREHGEMSPEEICMKISKTPEYINPILSIMEMKGFLCSAVGKFFLANM